MQIMQILSVHQDRDSRVRDRGRGSENSASRQPRGEALPRGTTSLMILYYDYYYTCFNALML